MGCSTDFGLSRALKLEMGKYKGEMGKNKTSIRFERLGT